MTSSPVGSPVKACPVLLRDGALLAFRHPRAGLQLVKGTIEPGETAAEAATRELMEEAGIAARAIRDLGTVTTGPPPLPWSFWLMAPPRLSRQWAHLCEDDGGHVFRFFWWPLRRPAGRDWHPIHRSALAILRHRLTRKGVAPAVRA